MNAKHRDTTPYWSTSASLAQFSRLTEDDRIVNCWPLERLLAWLADSSSECRR
jgi:hypothetical protein